MPKPKIAFEWVKKSLAVPRLFIFIDGKKIGPIHDHYGGVDKKTWEKALRIIYTVGYKDGGDSMEYLLEEEIGKRSLNKKETRKFLKKIEEGLKHPVGPVPTPKTNEAIRLIMLDAKNK